MYLILAENVDSRVKIYTMILVIVSSIRKIIRNDFRILIAKRNLI